MIAFGKQIVIANGIELMATHGAVIHAALAQEQHHNDGEQGGEVERNGADKQIEAAVIFHNAGNSGRPGRNGGNHADGSGGSIDEVSQLSAGNAVAIGNGTHDAADGEAVEVVIHEDEHAQQEGGEHGAAAGLDVGFGPGAESSGTAGLIEQGNENTQQNQEHEDTGIIADGGNNAIIDEGIQCFHMETGIEQSAGDGTDKQGAVHFLGDEGQTDCNDGGNERPECTKHKIYLLKNGTKKAMRNAENKSHGKK